MNTLLQWFENNNEGNCVHKWMHYLEIYDNFFKKYKNRPIVVLEIGVYQGGSLNMWRNYFGEEALLYAIDIKEECKQFESDNTKIFIGSQEDRTFLKYVKSQIPKIDILIDDGGHTMTQQIVSFEELYEHVKDDGIYICEDLHTSYWSDYGGGLRHPNSFIEYSKQLIDRLNAWHSRQENFKIDHLTQSMFALHYYDSMLVIEKRKMLPPNVRMSGKIIIDINDFPIPEVKQEISKTEYIKKSIKRFLRKVKSLLKA
jgi:cephalosporin hydroxylase